MPQYYVTLTTEKEYPKIEILFHYIKIVYMKSCIYYTLSQNKSQLSGIAKCA